MRSSVRRFGSAARKVPRATTSATGLEANAVLPQICESVTQDPGEILARFEDWRHAACVLDPPGARIVGGDRERDVAPVAVEQHPQVTTATFDVVARQKDVPYLMHGRRRGHELHESLRSLGRHGEPVEVRL